MNNTYSTFNILTRAINNMLGLEHLNPPITTRGVEVKCFDYTSSGMIRTQVIDTRVLLGSKGTEYCGMVSTSISVCTNPLLLAKVRQHSIAAHLTALAHATHESRLTSQTART